MSTSILIVFLMVGGVPVGSPSVIQSVLPDCRNELLIIDGINKSLMSIGSSLKYNAICNRQ